jgi:hypothetical protein
MLYTVCIGENFTGGNQIISTIRVTTSRASTPSIT